MKTLSYTDSLLVTVKVTTLKGVPIASNALTLEITTKGKTTVATAMLAATTDIGVYQFTFEPKTESGLVVFTAKAPNLRVSIDYPVVYVADNCTMPTPNAAVSLLCPIELKEILRLQVKQLTSNLAHSTDYIYVNPAESLNLSITSVTGSISPAAINWLYVENNELRVGVTAITSTLEQNQTYVTKNTPTEEYGSGFQALHVEVNG